MMTRKRVGKGREKKQSRRTKYGGNTVKESYGTSVFSRLPFSNDELITIDLDDESKKTDKSSNDTYWLIGGGLLVALVVGIAVPSALSKKH
jgi:hypothetical protein